MDNTNNQGGSQDPQRSGYPSRESSDASSSGGGYPAPPPSGSGYTPPGNETRRMDAEPPAYGSPTGQSNPYSQPEQPTTPYGSQPSSGQPASPYGSQSYQPPGQAQSGQPASPYGSQSYQPPGQAPYSGPGYQPPTQQQAPYAGGPAPYSPGNLPQQYGAPGAYNAQPTVYGPAGNFPDNAIIKDPTVAVLIEIVVGLFGFLGVGHMLSGRWVPGIIMLVSGWIIIPTFFFLFTVVTCGFGLCLLPLWPAVPILSGLWLRSELLGRPMFSR